MMSKYPGRREGTPQKTQSKISLSRWCSASVVRFRSLNYQRRFVMRAIFYALIVLAVGVTQGAAQNLPPELIRYADSILYNGKVLTADKNFTIAQAVAVR